MWQNETAWSKRHTRPTLRGEAGPSRRQDPASPARKEQDEMKLNIRNRDEAERVIDQFGGNQQKIKALQDENKKLKAGRRLRRPSRA